MSLFDDSEDDMSDFGMNSESDGDDDDNTTFTVANVLENRKEKSNRRDTITRIMPMITIHDSDKYSIPTTVEKARMDHYQQEDRCTQLWATESLMDDSPTNSKNDDDIQCVRRRPAESIFRNPSQDCRVDNELSYQAITVLRSIASASHINHSDVRVLDKNGIDVIRDEAQHSNRHSSDTSLSTREAIATTKHGLNSTKWHDKSFPAARGGNVKALVTSALKIVADGLAPLVVESWDADEHNLSGRKRIIGSDDNKENADNRMKNRRKSFNIRAEMTLLQDLVQEKSDECARLKNVSTFIYSSNVGVSVAPC